MNLKMITLKLAVAAMSAAMLLSQCISDPEGAASFRRSVNDGYGHNATQADGTQTEDVPMNDTVPAEQAPLN